MKRYACLIGFLLMSWALSAKTLVITLSDDTKVYYELEEPTNGTTFSPVMVLYASISMNTACTTLS